MLPERADSFLKEWIPSQKIIGIQEGKQEVTSHKSQSSSFVVFIIILRVRSIVHIVSIQPSPSHDLRVKVSA